MMETEPGLSDAAVEDSQPRVSVPASADLDGAGAVGGFGPEPGHAYETADGTPGEIRTVAAGERLRLSWQPTDRDTPTTLQLRLACPRNDTSRTTPRFHQERLADADEREAMREH